MEQNSEIIIYTDSDGTTKLQVQLEDETVWLTQDQMAMLFGKAKSTINEHIKNIYADGRAADVCSMQLSRIEEKTLALRRAPGEGWQLPDKMLQFKR